MFNHNLGEGATLELFQKHHAAALLEFIETNRDYLGEYLGWTLNMQTVEDTGNFIQRGLDRFAQDGLPWVAIYQNGEMAGGILFFPVDARTRSTEIGYWLGEKVVGRGLMSRAIPPMLDYAFDTIGLNRIGLIANVANTRSRAVAARLGFSFEGIKRDGWVDHGEYVDVAVHSMLARDWHALRRGERDL